MATHERPRVEVTASPVRCPFCHDDVAVSSDAWVACAECLARHHPACWQEHGRCGTCNGTRTLRPTDEAPPALSVRVGAPPRGAPESSRGFRIFLAATVPFIVGMASCLALLEHFDPPGTGTGLWEYEHPLAATIIKAMPVVLPSVCVVVELLFGARPRRRRAEKEKGA